LVEPFDARRVREGEKRDLIERLGLAVRLAVGAGALGVCTTWVRLPASS
jgi:hypothetical protein